MSVGDFLKNLGHELLTPDTAARPSNYRAPSTDPRSQQMARLHRAQAIQSHHTSGAAGPGHGLHGRNVVSTIDGRGSGGELARQAQNRAQAPQHMSLPHTAGYNANHQQDQGRTHTVNPLKKAFWTSSIPHAGKSYTDWAANAGDAGMTQAHDSLNALPGDIGNYFKHNAQSLDFGLDVNDGDQIIGLDNKPTPDPTKDFAKGLADAFAVSAADLGGFTGNVGSNAARGMTERAAAPKLLGKAFDGPASQAHINPLEHPALAETTAQHAAQDDRHAMDSLIHQMGFFDEAPKAPKPTKPANPVGPQLAKQFMKVSTDGPRVYKGAELPSDARVVPGNAPAPNGFDPSNAWLAMRDRDQYIMSLEKMIHQRGGVPIKDPLHQEWKAWTQARSAGNTLPRSSRRFDF